MAINADRQQAEQGDSLPRQEEALLTLALHQTEDPFVAQLEQQEGYLRQADALFAAHRDSLLKGLARKQQQQALHRQAAAVARQGAKALLAAFVVMGLAATAYGWSPPSGWRSPACLSGTGRNTA